MGLILHVSVFITLFLASVIDVIGRDFGAITFVGPLTVCFCSYFRDA